MTSFKKYYPGTHFGQLPHNLETREIPSSRPLQSIIGWSLERKGWQKRLKITEKNEQSTPVRLNPTPVMVCLSLIDILPTQYGMIVENHVYHYRQCIFSFLLFGKPVYQIIRMRIYNGDNGKHVCWEHLSFSPLTYRTSSTPFV